MGLLNRSIILIYMFCLGCGVKGSPIPPSPPAYLGRGEPSYKVKEQDKKKASEKKPTEEKSISDESK